MRAYLDSSVILRIALASPQQFEGWDEIELGLSSALIRAECFRTIDCMRLRGALTDSEMAEHRGALARLLARVATLPLAPAVLDRVADPFPTSLGTLDAIHLASALLWQRQENDELTFITHDEELGQAARAMGLTVLGCRA